MIHTRRFVDKAFLDVIRKSTMGCAAARALAIQVFGHCEANSRRMHHDVNRALVNAGVLLKLQEPTAPVEIRSHRHWLLDVLLGDEDEDQRAWTRHEPTFDNIVRLNGMHGPVILRMQVMLQPGQGAEEYGKYHCAVLLGTFEQGSRTIGVVLDGNDMQDNPAMSAIRDYMALHSDRRELFELTPEDLDTITKEVGPKAQTGEDLDVRQLGFRLVDLQALVSASERRYADKLVSVRPDSPFGPPLPNAVLCDEQASVAEALLPDEVVKELIAFIDKDPARVESF